MKHLPLLLFLALGTAPLTAQAPPELPKPFPGVANLREVAGLKNAAGDKMRRGVLLRSGSLGKAPQESLDMLRRYGIKRVIEIRTLEEIGDNGAAPPPFGRTPLMKHIWTDVAEFNPDFNVLFPMIWDENAHVVATLIDELSDPANHPVLFHGQAGLDRVGIMMAAVLEVAGVPRNQVIRDFEVYAGGRKPQKKHLAKVTAIWDAYEGGLEGWLVNEAGIHPMTLERVRHTLFHAEPFAPLEDEAAASEMFAKALEKCAKGQYPAAAKEYAKVAKKYPRTLAGIKASQRATGSAFLGWSELDINGPSSNRVDVVAMGEGYTTKTMKSFDKLAGRIPKMLEKHKLFGEYYRYHNFLQANLASAEDGVDAFGREYDTILNGHDSGAAQGQVAVDHHLVMKVLAEMPDTDGLATVIVKKGVLGTGGGGVATIGGGPSTTLIHEWGHAFGNLMDEYTTDVGYRGKVRKGINVANSPDPEEVAWKHWIEAGVKGVGIHEGAAGRPKGAWKATVKGCAMESGPAFCVVCREQLVLRIYHYVDPIDACDPPAHPVIPDPFADPIPPLGGQTAYTFKVTAMQPMNHELKATWWVLREAQVPPPPAPALDAFFFGDRRDRGPLRIIEETPTTTTEPNKNGVHTFEFSTEGLRPGRYRVVCRMLDDTRVPKSKLPWVLKDEFGVLESEAGWWVDVE